MTVRNLTVDCAGKSKKAILQEFGEVMNAPDWYGENFDALYDLLAGDEEGACFEILHWQNARISDKDRRVFEEIFEDAAEEAGHERLCFKFVSRII